MLVINLPHDLVPERAAIGVVGTLSPEFRGKRSQASQAPVREIQAVRKPLSGSFTLLAKGSPGGGDVIDDLPVSVLDAPEVKKARDAHPNPQIKIETYEVDSEKRESPKVSEDKPEAKDVKKPQGRKGGGQE